MKLKDLREVLEALETRDGMTYAIHLVSKEIERVTRKDSYREFERDVYGDMWTVIGKAVQKGVSQLDSEYLNSGRYRELCVGNVRGFDILVAPTARGRR